MILAALLFATTITTKADVPRVTPAELRALIEKGEAVAVDVRGSVPFKYGHIAGAVWMPLGLLNQRAGELPQDKLIVTYCTCRAEEVSLDGALRLSQQHGFSRVAVLLGGYPAWKDAGFPVEIDQTVLFDQEQRQKEQEAAERAAAGAAAAPSRTAAGRLAPPKAVACDRNNLTSHAGRITRYRREKAQTVLIMATSADTVETLTLKHTGKADASSLYLMEGQPFTAADWKRIEKRKGVLLPKVSAIAWVCRNGVTVIDWRPGVTFDGAE